MQLHFYFAHDRLPLWKGTSTLAAGKVSLSLSSFSWKQVGRERSQSSCLKESLGDRLFSNFFCTTTSNNYFFFRFLVRSSQVHLFYFFFVPVVSRGINHDWRYFFSSSSRFDALKKPALLVMLCVGSDNNYCYCSNAEKKTVFPFLLLLSPETGGSNWTSSSSSASASSAFAHTHARGALLFLLRCCLFLLTRHRESGGVWEGEGEREEEEREEDEEEGAAPLH